MEGTGGRLFAPLSRSEESLILTLAEQHLRNLLPANLLKSMEGFFEQAHRNLEPGAHANREREWLNTLRLF